MFFFGLRKKQYTLYSAWRCPLSVFSWFDTGKFIVNQFGNIACGVGVLLVVGVIIWLSFVYYYHNIGYIL